MKFLCVSKTQVVRHKYLKAHINTERLWPDPHCHCVCQQHPAFLLLLSSSSSYFSSFSPPPLVLPSSSSPPAVYYCELWQDDARLFPPHFWGDELGWGASLPLFTTHYDSRGPLGVRASNTGLRASTAIWWLFLSLLFFFFFWAASLVRLALLAHVNVFVLLLTTQQVIEKILRFPL